MADTSALGALYGAYRNRQRSDIQDEQTRIQSALGQAGLLEKLRAQQEMEQIKPILAASQGNPQKAIADLLKHASPQSIELATKLKGMIPKPPEPFSLGPGQRRFDPAGQVIAEVPEKQQMPQVAQAINFLETLSPNDPRRPAVEGYIKRQTEPRTQPQPRQSNVGQLLSELEALPEGDSRRKIYETALTHVTNPQAQRIIIPREPRQNPIVQTDQGIFERTPSGLTPLTHPSTGDPLRPPSLVTSGNQQAIRLRGEYNANPEVKLANMLEPRVRPTAEYVSSVGKGMGNPVGDAELVKLWLMTTHPKGDQIGQMDYRQIQALPDLWGRVKNVAGNFAFGKTLDSDTRADMWRSVANKFKATDEVRKKVKTDVINRAREMGVNENAIFSQE